MSTRQLRKLKEILQLEKAKQADEIEDTEVENFEPLFVGKPVSAYNGLELSSSSEEDDSVSDKNSTSHSSDEALDVIQTQKKNKNNKKKRNKNKKRFGIDKTSEEDDVDKVVAEVNKLLGEPEAPRPEPQPAPDNSHALLKINHKHLNVHNELNRMFGPDENEGRGKKRRPNLRLQRRQIIMTNETYSFTAKGLTMTLLAIKDGVKYFKFEHGPEYQKNMHTLVKAMKLHYDNYIRTQDYEVYPANTVEALIQNLDLYFNLDENSIAIKALEQAIYFMQTVFDPAFNYLDGKTRLEYRHVENRAFHIALLKYMHILTNKACHRTALEIAKLMLNLDPSDPLGVIFIVDTLALRAREHQWLVDIYDHWAVERDGTRLFHLRYSHALAYHHLYLKNKRQEDLEASNNLIKFALVMFPNVSVMLMELCNHNNAEVMNHEMFTTLANSTTSADLLSLQCLYAKFVWPKWREGNIMSWVTTNALEILARYSDHPIIPRRLKQGTEMRSRLFRKYPIEIKRHLSSIGPMSDLIVDGSVPAVENTLSFNPYPEQGTCVDVHRYYKYWGVQNEDESANSPLQQGIIRSFIASLVPDTPASPRMGNDDNGA